MHFGSVPEVSTSFFFFSCAPSLFLLAVWFMSHSLNSLLVFSLCSSPRVLGSPCAVLTHWISLAECVSSLFGRRLSRQMTCEVSLEDGVTRTLTSYGTPKLACHPLSWHWRPCLTLDPNSSEPDVSGCCSCTYLPVLNSSWSPESDFSENLESRFFTQLI